MIKTMKEVKLNGKSIKVASTVYAMGLFCPLPVIKLMLELEKTESSQIVELLTDDPAAAEDITAWCKDTNNKLVYLKKNEKDIYAAYVEKQQG